MFNIFKKEKTFIIEGKPLVMQKCGRKQWRARCPFHKEKTPSFIVDEKQAIYRCFSCMAIGNLYTIEQLKEMYGK